MMQIWLRQTLSYFRKLSPSMSRQFILSRSTYDDSFLSKREYWLQNYNEKQTKKRMEWLLDDTDEFVQVILSFLSTHLQQTRKDYLHIIDFGCGTSSILLQLQKEIYFPSNLWCLDYVTKCLQDQRHNFIQTCHNSSKCKVYFLTADVTALPFRDRLFDVMIDKGTLDSVLKDKKNGIELAMHMLKEAIRTLAPGGILLQVTDEDPDCRLTLLDKIIILHDNLSVSFKSFGNSYGTECFMFTITKKII
ncbi:hypothetical protein CHS0354_031400 [Potamilus streckersoni]|uniref:Methyltransferase domain-containing protein n=1 Tax=Potamilus streckersoni TaxID=2493646 RepID=A0AAE0VWL8_9BIVA|nr:hypothetical protein CHS0354_031400 [Potamilus streckersoni]